MATNQVTVFNPSAMRPAFATKGAVSAVTKALAGGANSGKRVSVRGGVFRLIADGKEVAAIDERYLDVVLVNAAPKVSRSFTMPKRSIYSSAVQLPRRQAYSFW